MQRFEPFFSCSWCKRRFYSAGFHDCPPHALEAQGESVAVEMGFDAKYPGTGEFCFARGRGGPGLRRSAELGLCRMAR